MSDRRPNARPRRRLLDRLSYANVAATLALFIAPALVDAAFDFPVGAAIRLWAPLVALAVVAVLVFVNAWAPAQDLPWKAFRLDRPVGMATPLQFARAAGDPALCRKALAEGGVSFVEEPARARGECATLNTVRLRGGTVRSPQPGR